MGTTGCFGALISEQRMSLQGRYRKSRRGGSSRWRELGRFARGQWPQSLTEPPFGPGPAAVPDDRLLPLSVSSPGFSHRPLTLHN